MSVLSKSEIMKKILDEKDELVISPLLDESQIGPSSIDLRVGTEFKVAIHSRNPVFGIVNNDLDSYYQTTYRNFGEELVIYPNQQILADTFEYVRIPQNCSGMLITRSSLQRIGLSTSSIVQPGYAGTLTISLENKTSFPVVIKSGMRIFQLVIYDLIINEQKSLGYIDMKNSKYVGNTSPVISEINKDTDLKKLDNF